MGQTQTKKYYYMNPKSSLCLNHIPNKQDLKKRTYQILFIIIQQYGNMNMIKHHMKQGREIVKRRIVHTGSHC